MSSRDDDKREYLRLAMVPSCAVDDSAMTPELLAYFVAFCSYASKRNDGRCWAAQEKIAKRMGVTRQAVSKAALRLAELGYMEVTSEWEESLIEGKHGKQLTNTYWIDLNKTAIPPERDRSKLPRKRAGIGGRKRQNTSDMNDSTPATPAVAPPATPAVAPPATPAVAPPATPAVAQNLEYEYGKGIRRGKRTRGEACAETPSINKWLSLPENAEIRSLSRYSEKIRAYDEWCAAHGLEPVR